jgi:SAM-dependent methyltransferase
MESRPRVVHDSQGGLDAGLALDDLLEAGVDYRRPPGGSLYDLVPLEGARVLDAGCGQGRFRPELERRGARYTGLDLPGNRVSVFGDLYRLPFADASFDRVLSSAVIEHLPDPVPALREAHRVLAPGGLLFGYAAFLEPFHGLSYHHLSHLGLAHVLRRAGFRPTHLFASRPAPPYQLNQILFPRRVPLIQPATVWLLERWVDASLALARGVRGLTRRGAGADDARAHRLLQELKHAVGFNFVAVREEGTGSAATGYGAVASDRGLAVPGGSS